MKKIIILTAFVVSSVISFSSSLILGYTQPGEELILENGTFQYDSVILLNGARLELQNGAYLKANILFVLKDSSVFTMSDSRLDVNNIFWMDGGAKAFLRDTVVLSTHLYMIDSTRLETKNCFIFSPMVYKGQYSWVIGGSAEFMIDSTSMNFLNGAIAGHFFGSANISITNSSWTSSILPITANLAGGCNVDIFRLSGGAEFVVNDSAFLHISNSDGYMIWYSFGDGEIADYSYPATNSAVFEHATDIASEYNFPDSTAIVTNVNFNIRLDTVNNVFWGLISKKGSDITVRNSDVYACGFFYELPDTVIADGLNNGNHYTDFSVNFSDRSFRMVNSSLQVINYYPAGSSLLKVKNSLFGEMLVMQTGRSIITGSHCDGSGGYFGVHDSGVAVAYNTVFERMYGDWQIISVRDNGYLELQECSVSGNMIVSGNGKLVLANSTYTAAPQLMDAAVFISVYDTAVGIDDTVFRAYLNFEQANLSNDVISGIKVFYSLLDSSGMTGPYDVEVYDTTETQMFDFPLSAGKYCIVSGYNGQYDSLLVWHVYYLNGDSLFAVATPSCMNTANGYENIRQMLVTYPNPAVATLYVDGMDGCEYTIYSMSGTVVKSGIVSDGAININALAKGEYIVKINGENKHFYIGKFVKK